MTIYANVFREDPCPQGWLIWLSAGETFDLSRGDLYYHLFCFNKAELVILSRFMNTIW